MKKKISIIVVNIIVGVWIGLLIFYPIGLITGIIKPLGYCSVSMYRIECHYYEYYDNIQFNESIRYITPIFEGQPFVAELNYLEANATYRWYHAGLVVSHSGNESIVWISIIPEHPGILFQKSIYEPVRGHNQWIDIFQLWMVEDTC